jgi:hypothetical protein
MPPKDDERWLEIVEELAEQHPIPPSLRQQIEDQIEPVTMNVGCDHEDAMSAIKAAYPLILNYFDRIDLLGTEIRNFAPEE